MSLEIIGIILLISFITSVVVGLIIETYVPKKKLANKVLINGEEINMRKVALVKRSNLKGVVVLETLGDKKSITVVNNGKEEQGELKDIDE